MTPDPDLPSPDPEDPSPDLKHVPPDVPPPIPQRASDPRGVKFVAGRSPHVLAWLRDYLGLDHPDDVHTVTINLTVGEAATVDVTMFLRSGALASMPEELGGDVRVEPTPDQLAAATFAVSRMIGARHKDAENIAREVLKAAAPGPEQHPRP